MDYPLSRLGILVTDAPEKGAERYLRDAKKTGMIEKDFQTGGYAVMLFAGGVPASAFFQKDGIIQSLSHSEFSALSTNEACKVRIIDMPDLAGRLILLALESKRVFQSAIRDIDDWRNHGERWKQEGWTGLIEIKSAELYGMTLVWRGRLQNDDAIFSTPGGVIADASRFESFGGFPWEISAYALDESDPAYQCALLRHAVINWMSTILARYREMVGNKLLGTMEQELNRQIRPWNWKIELGQAVMTDAHFFIFPQEAEVAYRALFMSTGMLMDIVIGSSLTQRLLKETFDQLHPDDINLLSSLRLIPAAFSE